MKTKYQQYKEELKAKAIEIKKNSKDIGEINMAINIEADHICREIKLRSESGKEQSAERMCINIQKYSARLHPDYKKYAKRR